MVLRNQNIKFLLDLFISTTRCGIGDCPCSLFFNLKLRILKQINKRTKNTSLNYTLQQERIIWPWSAVETINIHLQVKGLPKEIAKFVIQMFFFCWGCGRRVSDVILLATVYLNLLLVASCNVWNCPTSFLLYTFLVITIQQDQETGQSLMIDDTLNETKRHNCLVFKERRENVLITKKNAPL